MILAHFIFYTKKEPDHSDSFSHTLYFTVPSKLHTNFSSKPITISYPDLLVKPSTD